MTREETEWTLALVKEIFGRSEPRPEALAMLDRGEIPPEDGGDDAE